MDSQALFQLLTGPGVMADVGAKALEAVDKAVGVAWGTASLRLKEVEAGEVGRVGTRRPVRGLATTWTEVSLDGKKLLVGTPVPLDFLIPQNADRSADSEVPRMVDALLWITFHLLECTGTFGSQL